MSLEAKTLSKRRRNEVVLTLDSSSQKKDAIDLKVKDVVSTGEVKVPVFDAQGNAQSAASYDPTEYTKPYKKMKRGLSLLTRRSLSGWLFILPFLIGIIFIYAPIIVNSVKVTFFDVIPATQKMEFVGFDNYVRLFEDEEAMFAVSILDGLKSMIIKIPTIVIFSLFMAIILNQKMTGRAVFRAIFFLPVILSTGVIDKINSTDAFAEAVGGTGGVDNNTGEEAAGGIMSALDIEMLLGNLNLGPKIVEFITGLVNDIFDIVSRSGVQLLIFLSGLQSISPSIYESCQVEGASSWETFWKITLPMISPMILVNAVYTVIDLFTCYDNNVMIYYNVVYRKQSVSLAGALAWTYVAIVLVFIVIVALILKSVVFYQRRD